MNSKDLDTCDQQLEIVKDALQERAQQLLAESCPWPTCPTCKIHMKAYDNTDAIYCDLCQRSLPTDMYARSVSISGHSQPCSDDPLVDRAFRLLTRDVAAHLDRVTVVRLKFCSCYAPEYGLIRYRLGLYAEGVDEIGRE